MDLPAEINIMVRVYRHVEPLLGAKALQIIRHLISYDEFPYHNTGNQLTRSAYSYLARLRLVNKAFSLLVSPFLFRTFVVCLTSKLDDLRKFQGFFKTACARYIRHLIFQISGTFQWDILNDGTKLGKIISSAMTPLQDIKSMDWALPYHYLDDQSSPSELNHVIYGVLNAAPLRKLGSLRVDFPEYWEFDGHVPRAGVETDQVIQVLHRIRYLELRQMRAEIDLPPLWSPAADSAAWIFGCLRDSLYSSTLTAAKDEVVLGRNTNAPTSHLETLILVALAIPSSTLVSLPAPALQSLKRFEICHVHLTSGCWEDILQWLSCLPNLIFFRLVRCVYLGADLDIEHDYFTLPPERVPWQKFHEGEWEQRDRTRGVPMEIVPPYLVLLDRVDANRTAAGMGPLLKEEIYESQKKTWKM
ncbi:uncharacterized protein BO97DRAFT_423041 [Aspergillus homomorphus CBS 101889]|uniref:Uncharacterized protein n=1 Tax=Aspergillus homomorphus (strain CBS 101889) TaxID=1450537 RepID=A0A395I7C1_ASPHC|nr:hypothetical protein BO97DRAFT_423041 [Aspergillus homomorphus CBS 101889]RAL14124.1 hypothetical protein BO97DRAFT_423041 [Aspergillus homomorphus CBS 101889]